MGGKTVSTSVDTDSTDPRTAVPFDVEAGMVFEDTRVDEDREVVVEYASIENDLVVFVDKEGDVERDEITMWDTYKYFLGEVGAGRYELVTDEDDVPVRAGRFGRLYDLQERYESQSGRTASHKAEAIEEVLSVLLDDVPADHDDPVDFESISGIGAKAADNLRANGFRTKGDVRSADRAAIESVPLMGASNTDNLLSVVEQ